MGYRVMHKLSLVLFVSLWIIVQMNIMTDVQKNRTKVTCLTDFKLKVEQCTDGFLNLHHQLDLFSNNRNNRINIIYISIHRDIYCKRYIASLQCIHETLLSCSHDTATSIVQHRLSQLWALTANRICHINDKTVTNESHQILPTQITELLQNSSYQFLEPKKLGNDNSSNNLLENVITDLERGTTADNREVPIVSNAHSEKLNISENPTDRNDDQSAEITDGKLSFLMDQSLLFFKLLGNMISPATALKNVSEPFKNVRKGAVIRKTYPTGMSQESLKVKYETVILERLRITNNRDSTKPRHSNSNNNTKNSKVINGSFKPKSSVVKEFEMSTENRDSPNKKTNITTYKWKTKLHSVI